MNTISSFTGKYHFLSTSHPFHVTIGNYWPIHYPTIEHAYQGAMSGSPYVQQAIANKPTPGQARAYYKDHNNMEPGPHWKPESPLETMLSLLRLKFSGSEPLLVQAMMDTNDALLINGNDYGDTFWGVYNGVGEDHLGRLSMQVRGELFEEKEKIKSLLVSHDGSKKLVSDKLGIHQRQLYEKMVAYDIS